MVRFFHSNRPLVLMFIPLIIGIYYLLNLKFGYHQYEPPTLGFWGKPRFDFSLISSILAPVLIFLNALLLNTIFNRNEFMERNTYMVTLLYVIFMSFFHSFYFIDGLAVAQLFLILCLQQIFRLNQNEDARKRAFNLAFLAGIAATFHPILLISLPFLFWILWVFRPLVLRESLLLIIGFVLPLIYARVFRMYVSDELAIADFSSSSYERFAVDLITEGMLVMLFILFSLRNVFRKIQQGSIRLRKSFTILYMLSFLIVGLVAIEFFFFGKIQTLSLFFMVLIFILPYSFGSKEAGAGISFVLYLCFFYSLFKFFLPFIQ